MVTAFSRKRQVTPLINSVEKKPLSIEQEIMREEDDGRPLLLEDRTKKVSSRLSIAAWKAIKLASFDSGLSQSEILNRLVERGVVEGHCPLTGPLSGRGGDVHEMNLPDTNTDKE